MWSLAVRQAVRVGGSTYERPSNPHHGGNDAVIISTDANPSPGLSRVTLLGVMRQVQGRLPSFCADRFSFSKKRHTDQHEDTWDNSWSGPILPRHGHTSCYV